MTTLVGVTKCPVGIAHTYMAAEKLEQAAKKLGYDTVKIETEGASGTENTLTREEIVNADAIVFGADVAVDDIERFDGQKVVFGDTTSAIKDAKSLIEQYENAPVYHTKANAQEEETEKSETSKGQQNPLVKQLLNGVSHMIPFVVVGGLFIALSIAFGGHPTSSGMVIPKGTVLVSYEPSWYFRIYINDSYFGRIYC